MYRTDPPITGHGWSAENGLVLIGGRLIVSITFPTQYDKAFRQNGYYTVRSSLHSLTWQSAVFLNHFSPYHHIYSTDSNCTVKLSHLAINTNNNKCSRLHRYNKRGRYYNATILHYITTFQITLLHCESIFDTSKLMCICILLLMCVYIVLVSPVSLTW